MNEDSIFLAARKKGFAEARAELLDEDCAGSPSRAEGIGTHVGPYKLLQQIGEGGMSAVWMADQEVTVQRRVSLKIIKACMDSRRAIARFEAERQALATMDHQSEWERNHTILASKMHLDSSPGELADHV